MMPCFKLIPKQLINVLVCNWY